MKRRRSGWRSGPYCLYCVGDLAEDCVGVCLRDGSSQVQEAVAFDHERLSVDQHMVHVDVSGVRVQGPFRQEQDIVISQGDGEAVGADAKHPTLLGM